MSMTIPLTQGYAAIVDDGDFAHLNQWKWRAHVQKHGVYARRSVWLPSGKYVTVYMHKLVLGLTLATPGVLCDHVDGDTLNNTRRNLRLVTASQSIMNTGSYSNNASGFKGVYRNNQRDGWRVFITVGGRQIYLGSTENLEKAVSLRKTAEQKYFGDYARTEDG